MSSGTEIGSVADPDPGGPNHLDPAPLVFVDVLKVTDENSRIRIYVRIH